MSVEVMLGIMVFCWMHGRFYPWTAELVRKQKERAFEKRVEKARNKWHSEALQEK